MQKEDKYFAASIFFAVVAAFAIFSSLHHSPVSANAEIAEALPVTATRAEVVGRTHQADVQAHRSYVLVEFGDYQCPPCRAEYGSIKSIVAAHGPQVGFIFRHYPLMQIHPAAFTAALYAEAARDQEKFAPMHDLVYSDPAGVDQKALEGYASRLHLNMTALHQSIQTTAKARVRADMSDALALKLTGTPTLILCGPDGKAQLVHFQELKQTLPK
jgi:protein-disulfide isomerase